VVFRGSSDLFKAASHCLKVSKGLKLATDACKIVNVNEDDGGIFAKVKSALSFTKGMEGCEKLSMPYMRCLLQQKFKVDRISLVGCDNNTIDGVVFPASVLFAHPTSSGNSSGGGGSGSSSTSSGGGAGSAAMHTEMGMSTLGLVIFCSPNAGFYETISQCDFNSSWVGFYLKMGYDVCMFNYRGYGLSTGVPNPHGIKRDAGTVYEYLHRTRRPVRIVVHGESIGGMVACHLARHYPVDALVCDRTFSMLDATAARLMGSWAGFGLKYCTLWSTNVVRDYLACTCPKIVIQVCFGVAFLLPYVLVFSH
jgi:hypothetical protein